MKTILIDPPFYQTMGLRNRYFPYGLLSIATSLRARGHWAIVFDGDANLRATHFDYSTMTSLYDAYLAALRARSLPFMDALLRMVDQHQPDVVGIHVMTTKLAAAVVLAEELKQRFPSLDIVFGGPHVSLKSAEMSTLTSAFDTLYIGEGEHLENCLAGSTPPICRQERLALAEIPFPEPSLLVHKKSYSAEDLGLLMTSRGCPFQCAYCATSIWKRRVRYHDVPAVVAHMEYLYHQYHVRYFAFKDDCFLLDPGRVEQFCRILAARRLRIAFECNARIENITPAMLRQLKRAGLRHVKVGVESGSPRVLALMNKQQDIAAIEAAARTLHASGIFWTAYFLIGIPGERREDAEETVALLRRIKPDFASLGVYEPFPGTELFNRGVEKGLLKENLERDDLFTIPPNRYYMAHKDSFSDTMDAEAYRSLVREVNRLFHHYNRHLGRNVKRARSRLKLYLRSPERLLLDARTFWSYVKGRS